MSEIIEVITTGETIVIEPLGEIVEVLHEVVEVIEVAEQGPPGAPIGGLSEDPGNAATHGSDGGLYVPDDIPTDPLAFYILARS